MNYPEVDAVSDLKDYQERSVSVVGRVSNVQWQHLITLVPTHPDTFYFDIGNYQIVVYTDTLPPDDVRLRIYGKVIEVRGSSNHGDTKVKDSYRVYHIIADGWEVLDG